MQENIINQAKHLVKGLQRIINRLNPKYAPFWMFEGLQEAIDKAQCIQQEYERIMEEHGDEI